MLEFSYFVLHIFSHQTLEATRACHQNFIALLYSELNSRHFLFEKIGKNFTVWD